MIHEMKLKKEYFDLIVSGKKVYEVRLNDEKRRLIKVGDKIKFRKEPELKECVMVSVKDLILFNSFLEMAQCLPNEKIGFNGYTPEEIADVYHKFYSSTDEEKFGVLAILIEK